MKRTWKVYFVLGLLWGNTSDSLYGSSESSSLSSDASRPVRTDTVPGPRLCIRVYNLAEVPPATLHRAITEAHRIYQQAGIDTKWVKCTADDKKATETKECEQPKGPLMLSVKIWFGREKAIPVGEDVLFGVAEPYDQGGLEAALFYRHIDTFAKSGSASPSLVLAHAMTHEVGHLLLWSKSHSPKGVMKANLSRGDLQSIEQGKLAFSAEEAESMKANLLRRHKHYQVMVTSDGPVP